MQQKKGFQFLLFDCIERVIARIITMNFPDDIF